MSISKFGNQVIRSAIYAKQQKQWEDKKIYNSQKKIEKKKHSNAKEKLEKYRKGEVELTQKKFEKYQKDLEYKAKTPDEVRLERKHKEQESHKAYVDSVGKGKYIASQLFGSWILTLGFDKKKGSED
jgi:predicted secreted hydrolase